MKPVSLAVVGIDYQNKRGVGRRFELELCVPGETIELRPEPLNPYDEHAIAVFSCRGVQLGYLKSERAAWIGALVRKGHQTCAIFQGLTPAAAWVRIAFDGEEPTLPKARSAVADADFYPDEIWPDQ